jgi:hypothetical protein
MTWVAHGPVASMTSDPAAGVQYGVDDKGLFRIDPQLHIHQVIAPAPDRYPCEIAFDPPDRLLVTWERRGAAARFLGVKVRRATDEVEVMGTSAWQVLGSAQIKVPLGGHCPLYDSPVFALDAETHHGFVIEPDGRGVALNIRSGRLIRRFRTLPLYFDSLGTARVALDPPAHRLLVGVMPTGDSDARTPGVTLVDTRSGRIAGQVLGPFPVALAVDPTIHHGLAVMLMPDDYLFDTRSGRVLHRTPYAWSGLGVGAMDVDSPTHHGFLAYMASPNKLPSLDVLLMVDMRTGKHLKWLNLRVGGAYMEMADDPSTRAIYVCTYTRLYVIDAASDRLVQTVRIGFNIPGFHLTLDPSHHRVFIWGQRGILALTFGS